MHEAYQVQQYLRSSEGMRIESIAAYGDYVILGDHIGQLIMYTVENRDMTMLKYSKNISKKPITQMEVVAAEQLLFVLTDGMIHVCDISRAAGSFTLIHRSTIIKGCTLFTLNAQNVKTTETTKPTEMMLIRVCCVIKRRLEFFYWNKESLYTQNFNIDLKDIPKAISWTDGFICIGFKDEYILYNITDPQPEKHDVIVTSSQNIDPCICMLKNNTVFGISNNAHLMPLDPKEHVRSYKPLLKGAYEVGNKRLQPIEWSGPLLNLIWDEPYAIGRVANGVEVRSEPDAINRETLVQTLPELSKIKFLVRSGQGILFAATSSCLWCIRSVDVTIQRDQLLQQKRFPLAIDLTNISFEPEVVKAEKIRLIRMRYARILFEAKLFSEAMWEFQNAPADPCDVIGLFPDLLPDQPKPSESVAGAAVPTVPPMVLEDKDLENAILSLITFLTAIRPKEADKVKDKNSSTPLLSIIDTTLLKCHLSTNDSMVMPIVRMNKCHFGETEKILKKHNKINELTILYAKNGKHQKALELLRDQAIADNDNCDRIIEYLERLGKRHMKEIFEFADWVLNRQPVEGLLIFTDDHCIEDDDEPLPRAQVLNFLIAKQKALVIPYLEHIINVGKNTNTFKHNTLVHQYRKKVQQLTADLQRDEVDAEQKSQTQEELKQYRTKLYSFLKHSLHYSPDVVLKDFPTNALLEERAVILGRLGKHEKTLAIYIQILGDVESACEYCESHYEQDRDIFLTLLKIILNPLKQPPYEGVELHPDFIAPNQESALNIINKYAEKIDPCKLIPHLPENMPVYRLSSYLNTVLRTQMAEKHQLQIVKGLLTAEISRTKDLILDQTGTYFEINESTLCTECRKRINTDFVRYPSGRVFHLACHDKKL